MKTRLYCVLALVSVSLIFADIRHKHWSPDCIVVQHPIQPAMDIQLNFTQGPCEPGPPAVTQIELTNEQANDLVRQIRRFQAELDLSSASHVPSPAIARGNVSCIPWWPKCDRSWQ